LTRTYWPDSQLRTYLTEAKAEGELQLRLASADLARKLRLALYKRRGEEFRSVELVLDGEVLTLRLMAQPEIERIS